jgi:ribosomal protein S18 acetylase RimI-like enzyme
VWVSLCFASVVCAHGILQFAMLALADSQIPGVHLRPGRPGDLDALFDLEHRVFTYDRMSRRSFQRILVSPSAWLLIAEVESSLAGYVLLFFRQASRIARLYSIALEPSLTGRGIGLALLIAAEIEARRRGAQIMRLEVREDNASAIERYRRLGYVETDQRPRYYDDGSNALRFEKQLTSVAMVTDSALPSPGVRGDGAVRLGDLGTSP